MSAAPISVSLSIFPAIISTDRHEPAAAIPLPTSSHHRVTSSSFLFSRFSSLVNTAGRRLRSLLGSDTEAPPVLAIPAAARLCSGRVSF
ncbi:hypothetical protein JCGZ_10890 [Jatropha curcas]|uniref:Uncharacterized protein n=1 Tax=Jatropha curcas TaxID=180498 RepID=A0A067KQY4_JATCU|nr:hypothetical protein JCGZ_10890 [Jatropha curcas]